MKCLHTKEGAQLLAVAFSCFLLFVMMEEIHLLGGFLRALGEILWGWRVAFCGLFVLLMVRS